MGSGRILPSPNQPERAGQAPLVVICADVGDAPSPLIFRDIAEHLRREVPGVIVVAAERLCQGPRAIAELVAGHQSRPVVIGCRNASQARADLFAALRRAGVGMGGTDIVDLRTGADCGEADVVGQSAALLCAAAARVASADLTVRTTERASFSVGAMSRRSLFRGFDLARRPIATWLEERCCRGAGCVACLRACRHEALRRASGRVFVDGDRCTGCGSCVVACPESAVALAEADLEAIGAAAAVLVRSVRRTKRAGGVAITCQHAGSGPLVGEEFLALRIPSLEMVSAGWLLQIFRAGVAVRLVSCDDKLCAERAGDLESFIGDFAAALGLPGPAQLQAELASNWEDPAELPGPDCIELREPEATTLALAALGAKERGRAPWAVDGPGCPRGRLEIDAGGCSFCEVCVGVCPTGAIISGRDDSGSLCLILEAARCTACGACAAACPEQVINLERTLESATLTADPRVVAVSASRDQTCALCGAVLAARLPASALSRMGSSHGFLAPESTAVCPDCRLGGRSVAVSPAR